MTLIVCLISALIWGAFWALFLQTTRPGQFLAARRAWLAVVIGLGVDLLIILAILPVLLWLQIAAVIAVSAIGIIARSLWNEYHDHRAIIEDMRRAD